MKLTTHYDTLQQTIQDLQKSIPSRPSLPILSCVLISVSKEGKVTFSVTDLNIGASSSFQVQDFEEGIAAVPAKVFVDFIHSLPPGEVELSLDGQTLTIKTTSSKATLQCLEAKDFPTFPEKEGQEYSINAEQFLVSIQQVVFAASLDEARPILTAVLFQASDPVNVVATDGFRLAVTQLKETKLTQPLLLPAKALAEVVRISTRKKTQTVVFTLSEKLKQVFFMLENVELVVRTLDGDFPPYQKIIPPSFSTQLTFDGQEFVQRMKTALIFARESSGVVRFKISESSLTILSSSASLGTQESTLPIELISGGNQEIAFNARYISDFVSIIKPERIWFGMNESLKPALFRPENAPDYQYIVMPFRVNQ